MKRLEIEGFRVEEYPVGRGCNGEVYRAWNHSGQQEFAVKRYNSMAIDRRFMEQMNDRLKNAPLHEGIVPLHDYRFSHPPYYSISKFEDGDKLAVARLLDETDVWRVIFKLADALAHAHKHRVAHGNLHPGNIFYKKSLTGDATVRVTDFASGLIGNVHHIDLGENAYFSPPEQLLCLGVNYQFGNAEKWDVYRFGAIAYWLINGNIYPRGNTYREARARALAESGGRPVHLNPIALARVMEQEQDLLWETNGTGIKEAPYRKILERCLAVNPEDRPHHMQEVHATFQPLHDTYLRMEPTLPRFEFESLRIPETLPEPVVNAVNRIDKVTVSAAPSRVTKKKLIDWFRSGGRLNGEIQN